MNPYPYLIIYIQIIKGLLPRMVLKLTKYSLLFTNVSSESNFQHKKGSKILSYLYKK